jgi:uncharacterized protein YbjQ (UPF0145 family)
MIIVTTPSLEGRRITRYVGLVSGEAILGANIFRDLFAGIRDIVGGRSAAYEQELRKAKALALDEMQDEAQRLGGNAIVGVDLDYETITMGSGGGMLMVSASGTAVVIEKAVATGTGAEQALRHVRRRGQPPAAAGAGRARPILRPALCGAKRWVGVWLGRATEWTELAKLLRDGYRMVAPNRLLHGTRS